MVDERTADVTVGSDMQVISSDNLTISEIESLITEISDDDISVSAVHIPTITLIPEGGERITAYVLLEESADVLKWLPQAIPGRRC